MLRTFAALVWREASGPEGHGRQGSGLDKHGLWVGAVIAVSVLAAAGVLSMVFPWRARRLQGIWGGGFERPCLADLLPAGRGEGVVGCREVGVDKQGRVPPIAEGRPSFRMRHLTPN